MTDEPGLAQSIADIVVATYNDVIPRAAKPAMRLNGVREWTVLAGLVAIEGTTLKPLTLATGVKTMPNDVREYSSGLIVHDLHAELLCLRMFNWSLVAEVKSQWAGNVAGHGDSEGVNGAKRAADSEGISGVNLRRESVATGGVLTLAQIFEEERNGGEERNGQQERRNGEGETDEEKEEDAMREVGNDVQAAVADNQQSTAARKGAVQTLKKYTLLHKKQGQTRFTLRDGVRLALYISEPPCGDALMSAGTNGGASWEPPLRDEIIRGRAHFNSVGIVRTKPGRADSKISYSKSCSDKLCIKQVTGILNAISSWLIEPIYLLYLVVPREKYAEVDFLRCFHERLQPEHKLQVLQFGRNEFPFRKVPDTGIPLPLCFVRCELNQFSQVLQNGVKNGAFVKKKPPRRNGESVLCQRRLWEQSRDLVGTFKDYRSLKTSDSVRVQLKAFARAQLGLWPASSQVNFQLD
ncbi:hypothetical protein METBISCDRAFT_25823 [Metschnikowia bicuspidata]|uniref:A to I editase domain-containing protein n=1 Tax=Metschnikowia bicuspidata TaxID=27322 RepID=A0A4P9ZGT1_9ASCO|nr:hypothetical protein METBISCDRAFT_25823 [Metschnikowia bicuspidata]